MGREKDGDYGLGDGAADDGSREPTEEERADWDKKVEKESKVRD